MAERPRRKNPTTKAKTTSPTTRMRRQSLSRPSDTPRTPYVPPRVENSAECDVVAGRDADAYEALYKTSYKPSADAVNPSHYKQGPIEVIEIIEGFDLGFHLGNVVKYVLRHKHKNGVEDLKKARWYLDRAIEKLS